MTTPVLHEDADLVAVSKPAGEPVIPARGEPFEACLHRRLERERGEKLWVVHRLDRDTSGAVVFARHAEAHRALSLAFEHRHVEKVYLAFVSGEPPSARGRIDLALHEARKGKARPAHPGEPGRQHALTEYEVRRTWRDPAGRAVATLVEAHPHTGRHHQVRVHLRSLDTPILFDALYGRGAPPLPGAPCSRLALHASRLVVPSPSSPARVEIEAALADDLAALRAWLDAGYRGA